MALHEMILSQRKVPRGWKMFWRFLSLTLALMVATGGLLPSAKAEKSEMLALGQRTVVRQIKKTNASAASSKRGAVTIAYVPEVIINPDSRSVRVSFNNPLRSTHDLMVRLCVVGVNEHGEQEEILIAQSGLIPAGCGIDRMALLDELDGLPKKIENARYYVDFYSPTTGALVASDYALDGIEYNIIKG